MAFLNPLVLIGIIAAAVPLLVHFFNFRQPQRLDFSSLALLHALKTTTIQRMRIRQWLLLLLRTLAICMLVAAFARPVLTGTAGGQFMGRASMSMAVVLDNSLSMTQGDAGGPYLEQIRASARTLLQQSQHADEIFIMTSSDPAPDRMEDVPHLDGSAVTTTAATAISRAAQHLEQHASHAHRMVLYMGDLQQSTLADSLPVSVPNPVAVHVIPMHAADRPNVAVTRATVLSRIVGPGEPVRIEASVINHGTVPIEDWAVSLYLEGERVAQSGVSLLPGVPTRVVLSASPQSHGWLAGYVEGEDDSFYQDNRQYLTLHVPQVRRILIAGDAGSQTASLEMALSLEDDQSPFRAQVISAKDLLTTALGRYDAVFLVGLSALSTGQIAELARYVEQGGGLMLFPSEDLTASNALLAALDAGSWQLRDAAQTVTHAEFDHALFEGIFETTPSGPARRIEPVEVYRLAAYSPGTAVEQPLIRLSGGEPFLQEIRHGRGRGLLLAVTPDHHWSDFPVRGLFVTLLYRAAHYLSAGGSVQGDRLVAGQPGSVRVRAAGSLAQLITPSGLEIVPSQHQLFGSTLLDVRIDKPGIVDITVDGQLRRRMSISLDPRESRLTYASPEEASDVLSEALNTPVDMILADAPAAVMQARRGRNLWRHFLIAALLLLVAEMFVAMRWRTPGT